MHIPAHNQFARFLRIAWCCFLPLHLLAADEDLIFHPDGRLKAILVDQTPVPVQTDVLLATPGWKTVYSLSNGNFPIQEHNELTGNGESWRAAGTIAGSRVELIAELDRSAANPRLLKRLKVVGSLKLEGVFWVVNLPVHRFATGSCTLFGSQGVHRTQLPPSLTSQNPRLLSFPGNRLEISLPEGNARLLFSFPPAEKVIVQDNRFWGKDFFSIMINIHRGSINPDTFISSALHVGTAGKLPNATVRIDLAEPPVRRAFAGFGGNYCFQYKTPVTAFTLEALAPRHLRTELDLALWQPESDTYRQASPELDARLRLYRQLKDRQVPVIASVWTLPEWLFEQPGRGFWTPGRILPTRNWEKTVDCIGTYLAFCKQQTGWEPELFSFNEPALGIRIKFTSDELAAICKKLDGEFRRRKLNTRILLGDTASVHTLDFVKATYEAAQRPDIFGALGFHSWGTCPPDILKSWQAFAEKTNLPLLATEVGLDGSDYQTPWIFDDTDYAIREAQRYCDLLRHAHVLSTLHWQLTPDYAVVTVRDDIPVPSYPRFAQLKQFFGMVPDQARHLNLELSGAQTISACALAGGEKERPEFTLHCVNSGGKSELTVSGVPEGVSRLVALNAEGKMPEDRQPLVVDVVDGSFTIQLSARSMWSFSNCRARD